jgi:hypothetical protein
MKVSRCDRPTDFRQSVCFHRCKAQTSSMASQKLIKEDHFLRAPRECLRYLDETNRSSPHRDLSEPFQYTRTFELTSSRHPTIHFSKNKTVSRRNVAYNFRCLRRVIPGGLGPDWGGESYRRFRGCQRGVKNFFRTLKNPRKRSYFIEQTKVIGPVLIRLAPIRTLPIRIHIDTSTC